MPTQKRNPTWLPMLLIAGLLWAPAVALGACGENCGRHAKLIVAAAAERHCDRCPSTPVEPTHRDDPPATPDEGGCCDNCQFCCVVHAQVFSVPAGWVASVAIDGPTLALVSVLHSTDATDGLLRPPLV